MSILYLRILIFPTVVDFPSSVLKRKTMFLLIFQIRDINYDQKIGFFMQQPKRLIPGYVCEAIRNGNTDERRFTTFHGNGTFMYIYLHYVLRPTVS